MAGAVDKDYTEILETLPLPEKYLMSKAARGSQGSSDSDEWTMETDEGHVTQSETDHVTDRGHVVQSDKLSTVSTDSGVRQREWGSADTGLHLLGQGTRADGGPWVSASLSERRSEERYIDMSQKLSNTLAACPDHKVRSLGGTPTMDRKYSIGKPLQKPRSTESILSKVKELLGDQTARAKVTGIVEAQRAVIRTLEPKNVVAVSPGSKQIRSDSPRTLTDIATVTPGSKQIRSDSPRTLTDKEPSSHREANITHTTRLKTVGDLTTASDRGTPNRGYSPTAKSRRAVKNTGDISLFTPRFTVLRDGRLLDRECPSSGASHDSDRHDKGVGSIGFGGTRNSDNVPTAHVSPSPLVTSRPTGTCNGHRSNLTKFPSEENIRGDFGSLQPDDRSVRRTSDITGIDAQLEGGNREQWNPQQLNTTAHNQFQALDPSVTCDQTQYLAEDPYKKAGVIAGSAPRQLSRHIPGTSDVCSQNTFAPGHHLRSGSTPSLSGSVSVDSGYRYPTSRYNPQTYTGPDYPTPYSASHHVNQVAAAVRSDPFASDITSWQQRHQEALQRQQLEATQPAQHLSMPQYHHTVPQTSATDVLLADPHKLDAIKQAADNIIKEKDMIIERQKGKIVNLERHTKDSELQRQKEILHRELDHSDNLKVKLQEYEYEIATLKARLTEYATSKKSSQDEIEKKLGASEYQLQQLKQKLMLESTSRTEDIGRLAEQLSAKNIELSDIKSSLSDEKRESAVLRKQNEGLERYLNDLPTVDEHGRRTEEIQTLRDDLAQCQQRLTEVGRKLTDAQKGVKSRDGLIQTLESNEGQLKSKLEKVQGERARLHQRLTQEGLPTDDVEELQYQNKQLQAELDKARKLVDTKHKRQQQIEARHRVELSQVEERLSQEESTVTALREEVMGKDQNLIKLRKSLKEMGSENQDLLQKNMSQKDAIDDLQRQLTGDIHKLENRLMREIGVCFSELQSLVHICVQNAEGKDPNISALLGVKATSADEPEPDVDAKDIASLKFKVTKVREMRNEIDKLRELISNKYAEEMGANLNCTTQ